MRALLLIFLTLISLSALSDDFSLDDFQGSYLIIGGDVDDGLQKSTANCPEVLWVTYNSDENSLVTDLGNFERINEGKFRKKGDKANMERETEFEGSKITAFHYSVSFDTEWDRISLELSADKRAIYFKQEEHRSVYNRECRYSKMDPNQLKEYFAR